MTSRLIKDDFDIGDIVRCNSGEALPLYAQVVDICEDSEEKVCQTRHSADGAILTFEPYVMKQPIACVEMVVPSTATSNATPPTSRCAR